MPELVPTGIDRMEALAPRRAPSLFKSVESPAGEPDADDAMDRFMKATAEPPRSAGDTGAFIKARAVVVALGERGLKKAGNAPLDRNERFAVEAIIATIGRPVFVIDQGAVDAAEAAVAGEWTDELEGGKDLIPTLCASVGRLEPVDAVANDFFGTGFVVDHGKGLVLTNRHVFDIILRDSRVMAVPGGDDLTFRILDGAFMDFAVELKGPAPRRCRVVEVRRSPIDGPDLARLDAAVVKIEPLADGPVPAALTVKADRGLAMGQGDSLCVIGHPGRPEHTAGLSEGVDWGWIHQSLFGRRYGVKRLSPGTVHKPLGFDHADQQKWAFGHDASTLGGSSGSPVIDWTDPAAPVFGLHFAGRTGDANYAHAMSACAQALRDLGVPVV